MKVFEDRSAAGAALAAALERYRGRGAVVLGVPRGGLPIAAAVAAHLGAELDVIVARKLGAPGNPELAIGAVTADGGRYVNADIVRTLGVSSAYLEAEIERKMAEAREREIRLREGRAAPRLAGRVVLVVDDGLATGATMRAAVRSVRRAKPSHLIVGVPVGAPETCATLRPEVDELVCLEEPDFFAAVGQFYTDFPQVSEGEAREILRSGASAAGSTTAAPR